jgi:hypothetical protein
MNLNDLLSRLQANHHHDSQSYVKVTAAIREVEHGLHMLAIMGHVYHLEPGPPYDLPEWPRILFHVFAAPNGRVIQNRWEAEELGPGWWPTLQEAQHKEGIRAQFRGRGGVGDRSLPMLMDGPPAPRGDYSLPTIPSDNSAIIEEFKRNVARPPSTANGDGRTSSNDRGDAPEGTSATDVSKSLPG